MSPDEEKLIEAIQTAPDDNDARLVYADWLETQSDPRAEYVRLEVELASAGYGSEDAEKRNRLEEIAHTMDADWRSSIGRGPRVRVVERAQLDPSYGRAPPRPPPDLNEAMRTASVLNLPTVSREAWRDKRVSSLPPPSAPSSNPNPYPHVKRVRIGWGWAIVIGVVLAFSASCQYNKLKHWWNGETGYGVMPH